MTEEELNDFSSTFDYMQEHSFVDVKEHTKYPPVAISAGVFVSSGTVYPIPLVTYGNILFIQAPPKTKKTFFVSLLASSYLNGKKEYTGMIQGHGDGRKLLHIDTEQGKWHASRTFRRVVDMCEDHEGKYVPYALREWNCDDMMMFMETYLHRNNDTGVIIVDGVADLVRDVNDITASFETVKTLMRLSSKYKCAIVTVIHSNYGSDKPTGHLGSFLEKKAETQIKLTENPENKGLITAECKRSRNTPFESISFRINEHHYPEVVDIIDPLEEFRDELFTNTK